MLLLRHNSLPSDQLIVCESTMLKFIENKLSETGMYFNVWDWSIPELYGIVLGMMVRLDLNGCLQIQESEMLDFIIDVEKGYIDADYHSFYHAVDVVAMLYYILTDLDAAKHLTQLDSICLMIAGLCHDIGHPGLNNVYQVNAKTSLAIKYKDISVLENHSSTLTIKLLSKHRLFRNLHNHNEFQGIDPQTIDLSLKSLIEETILATDMMYHYDLLESLHGIIKSSSPANIYYSSSLSSPCSSDDSCGEELDDNSTNGGVDGRCCYSSSSSVASSLESSPTSITSLSKSFSTTSTLLNKDQRLILLKVLLHAADLSNTVRPWNISKHWSDLVVEEFFKQGDLEKQQNLPVSPNMDREQVHQSQLSLGFGDFVVKPYFEAFALFLNPATIFLSTLAKNRVYWDEMNNSSNSNSNDNNNNNSSNDNNNSDHNSQLDRSVTAKNNNATVVNDIDGLLSSPLDLKSKISLSTKSLPTINTIVTTSNKATPPTMTITVPSPSTPQKSSQSSPITSKQRRVSLAAGLLIIPDDIQEKLCRMSIPHTSYLAKHCHHYCCHDDNDSNNNNNNNNNMRRTLSGRSYSSNTLLMSTSTPSSLPSIITDSISVSNNINYGEDCYCCGFDGDPDDKNGVVDFDGIKSYEFIKKSNIRQKCQHHQHRHHHHNNKCHHCRRHHYHHKRHHHKNNKNNNNNNQHLIHSSLNITPPPSK